MFSIFFYRKAAGKGFECLFIQCDTGEENVNLVSCARHSVLREISMAENICVIFIVHLSRVCKVYFNGFQVIAIYVEPPFF